jgi:WD40 repeat protein
VRVWDLDGNAGPRVLEGHTGGVTAVALDGSGKRAVSGSGDTTVRVWDLDGNAKPRVLEGHTGGVSAVALDGSGKRAVSGSYDKTVRVWDLETKACLAAFICDGSVLSCAWSGNRIVAGDATGRVHLFRWDG